MHLRPTWATHAQCTWSEILLFSCSLISSAPVGVTKTIKEKGLLGSGVFLDQKPWLSHPGLRLELWGAKAMTMLLRLGPREQAAPE